MKKKFTLKPLTWIPFWKKILAWHPRLRGSTLSSPRVLSSPDTEPQRQPLFLWLREGTSSFRRLDKRGKEIKAGTLVGRRVVRCSNEKLSLQPALIRSCFWRWQLTLNASRKRIRNKKLSFCAFEKCRASDENAASICKQPPTNKHKMKIRLAIQQFGFYLYLYLFADLKVFNVVLLFITNKAWPAEWLEIIISSL